MNSVNLIGRLTAEPEAGVTAGGTETSKFRIAVRRDQETADFINCEAYGKSAETVNRYVRKGHLLGVAGSLRFDQWKNPEGENRSKTYVNVSRIDLLEKKSDVPDGFGLEGVGGDLPF